MTSERSLAGGSPGASLPLHEIGAAARTHDTGGAGKAEGGGGNGLVSVIGLMDSSKCGMSCTYGPGGAWLLRQDQKEESKRDGSAGRREREEIGEKAGTRNTAATRHHNPK